MKIATHTLLERRMQQREWLETHELRRDAWLDLLGVYGPVICPLIPGGLSAASMINVFPTLLHIPLWAAIVIALITVAGVEVLALLATETWLAMRRFNQTMRQGEEQAPAAYAGFVVFLYCGVVLSLVVFLKMWSGLAIYSLIPLTLMGLLTSWTVILRKQFNDLLFKREVAKGEKDQRLNLQQQLEEAKRQLDEKEKQIQGMLAQIETHQNMLIPLNCTGDEPVNRLSPHQQLNQGSNKTSLSKREIASLRRVEVLKLLQNTASKDEINFEQWGRNFDVSGQTIANDLRWLINQNYWQNGDRWEITGGGSKLIEQQLMEADGEI